MPSVKTLLTFYGGVDEIGGNKILVDDGQTRIFLDFGKSYTKRGRFYEWTDKPRLVNGIGDLIALGIVPEITGLYRRDLLLIAGLWNAKERDPSVNGILLSHAHGDHADYISFLREDIPIWMGEMAKGIIECNEAEKNSDLEYEITKYRERPRERGADKIERKINTFKTGSKFSIDSILIEPIHVDHSLPGCYGFIITTRNATIVYSGDLRMHGNKPELTEDFVRRAADAKPDLMLCEGTRIQEATSMTEKQVFGACKFFVDQAKEAFVFAEYSYKDLDRFVTFYELAKQTDRKLLIDPKTARYLEALSKLDPRLGLPKSDDKNIGIYKPRSLKYDKEDEPYYNQANMWTASAVNEKESDVIFTAGLHELIDIRPKGGIYVHANTEAYSEAGEIDEDRTQNWMKVFGLEKIHAHCSGHASATELVTIVNRISPGKVVPIHTESAETFKVFFHDKVTRAEPMQTIELC
ncbi:MAG: MBL fold metallo-hydrolase [Nitrososphaerales archaeon]